MTFPDFILGFPALDVPFEDSIVKTNAIQSDAGLVVFFTFFQDMSLPPHSHGAQWGTVIEGEIALTIDGTRTVHTPGQSYAIPAGVEHAVEVKAGTKAIDVFEEGDRYPVKA